MFKTRQEGFGTDEEVTPAIFGITERIPLINRPQRNIHLRTRSLVDSGIRATFHNLYYHPGYTLPKPLSAETRASHTSIVQREEPIRSRPPHV